MYNTRFSRQNTHTGDVGQYEEARTRGFKTGRLPFSDANLTKLVDTSAAARLEGAALLDHVRKVEFPLSS